MDTKGGGYSSIMTGFATQLVKAGHKIVYLGIAYDGSQHPFPFPVVPVLRGDFYNQCKAMAHNIDLDPKNKPDIVLVGLDVPMQLIMQEQLAEQRARYIGLFPIEAPPMIFSWATGLSLMKGRLCMTRFGTKQCTDMGLSATYFPVPIDRAAWRAPVGEEKA